MDESEMMQCTVCRAEGIRSYRNCHTLSYRLKTGVGTSYCHTQPAAQAASMRVCMEREKKKQKAVSLVMQCYNTAKHPNFRCTSVFIICGGDVLMYNNASRVCTWLGNFI